MEQDFETHWLGRLRNALQRSATPDAVPTVMAGSEGLRDSSPRRMVIEWTEGAMDRLCACCDLPTARRIMADCSCRPPAEDVREAARSYRETGDVAAARAVLLARFEGFLRETVGLDETSIREILGRGWGMAGVLEGDTITATKIPKSGNLARYLCEEDAGRRRQLYCHCPRVREAAAGTSPFHGADPYCHCGAGYYKALWEGILGRPVTVRLLTSVLAGDEVCSVAVHLPR